MLPKKNVLLVINSELINGGVPNVIMKIVRRLSDRFSFDIVTYYNGRGLYDEEFESYGGKIFRLSLLDYSKHKLSYPFRYCQIKKRVKRILKEKKYDVIHCHDGRESGIFLKFAEKAGVPVRISHAHGTYARGGNNKILLSYYSKCKKLIIKNSTKLLACSTQAGESLFGKADFTNVLNPVDAYSSEVKRVEHEGFNLLQIGYYCENKNQLFSMKLLRALIDDGINARLTFIGFPQEADYYEKMLKAVNELSLSENVIFLPSDADKAKVFSETDLVLMPSFTEGLPLVALESQMAHVKCLLSDKISTDANIGLVTYAEYGNVDAWKDAALKIYRNETGVLKINIDTDLIETGGWCNRIEAIYNGN